MTDIRVNSQLIMNGSSEPPGYVIEKYHNIGGCYWIVPVRIKDMNRISWHMDNQEILAEEEISIDQSVFEKLLYPIFKRYFDNVLPENMARGEEYSPNRYKDGIAFDRDLSDNFYSFEQVEKVLYDIAQIVESNNDDYSDLEIGFYRQFNQAVKKMIKAGIENGYKILSVGSP